MRHELAYCLGQMQDPLALPVLEKVLRDGEDDPIVRHEVCVPQTGGASNGGSVVRRSVRLARRSPWLSSKSFPATRGQRCRRPVSWL